VVLPHPMMGTSVTTEVAEFSPIVPGFPVCLPEIEPEVIDVGADAASVSISIDLKVGTNQATSAKILRSAHATERGSLAIHC
jgi:hypothetical protein